MHYSTRDAATLLGVSQRQVQRMAAADVFSGHRIADRIVVAGREMVAAERLQRPGRRWSESTVLAAIDLLTSGKTNHVVGTQLSRLKSRIRSMSPGHLAHQVLTGHTSVFRSAIDLGEDLRTIVTTDAKSIIRTERLIPDPNGQVIVVDFDTHATELVRDLVEFTYADARFSAIAAERLSRRMQQI